jgi:hypothetical protein
MPLDINPKFISEDMATDAELDAASTADRNPATPTGTLAASTISDFDAAVQAVTIDAAKIGSGIVSNAEFAALDGVTSAIQSQLNGKEPTITPGIASQYYRGDKTFQTLNATAVANTPSGNIASTTVQAALNELDTEKQPVGNYVTALTGDVTANGPGSVTATLAASGVVPGTYNNVTVDAKGRVTFGQITQWTYRTTVAQGTNAGIFIATNELITTSLPPGLYKFDAYVIFQSTNTNTGMGVRVGPGTATITTISSKAFISQATDGTIKNFQVDQLTNATNVSSASTLAANTNFSASLEGVFRVTVAGTVGIEFRSEGGGGTGTISIRPDSVFRVVLI